MYTYSKTSESRRGAQGYPNKTALVLGISLIFGAGVAQAAHTTQLCNAITSSGNNFTMLTGKGAILSGGSGTNDVVFHWNGDFFNASSDYTGPGSVSNATLSSTTAFSGYNWTAHDIQVFAPGTYTFDTSISDTKESGSKTMTVGAKQFGMHMLFDWNGNTNIDVLLILDKTAVFGSGNVTPVSSGSCTVASNTTHPNCLWSGIGYEGGNAANAPTANQVWSLASSYNTDPSNEISGTPAGTGAMTPGTGMAIGGAFPNFHANFNFKGTLSKLSGPEDGTCGLLSKKVSQFDFGSPVTNAIFSTDYISPAITIGGLDTNQTSPISITGGSYSINGGPYVTTAGTVSNNDKVTVKGTSGNALGVTVTVTLNIDGIVGSFLISTPAPPLLVYSNFTMIDGKGTVAGGANDVQMDGWDFSSTNNNTSFGTLFNVMKLTSNTSFDGYFWKAHDIRVFDPNTTPYTFNTACTITELHANGGQNCANPGDATHGPLSMTVGPNQYGAHMLFDWGSADTSKPCGLSSCDIDVAIVWDRNKKFGPSPMSTQDGGCPDTIWELSSIDAVGDGRNGIPMKDGAFPGFRANFNLRVTDKTLHPGCTDVPIAMTVGDTGVKNGAGCSLSTTPVNPLERGDWWLLLGFVAWMGGLVVKRKRAQ